MLVERQVRQLRCPLRGRQGRRVRHVGEDDPDGRAVRHVRLQGERALQTQYQKVCPNITIKEDDVEQSADYWTKLKTRLASGSGLDDVQGIEIGFVADVVQNHADTVRQLQHRDERGVDQGCVLRLEVEAGHQQRRQGDGRARHRRRPRGDLLPPRPAQEGRPALRPGHAGARSGRPGRTSSTSASSTRPRAASRPVRTSSTAPPASSRPPSTRAPRPTTTRRASPTSRRATA